MTQQRILHKILAPEGGAENYTLQEAQGEMLGGKKTTRCAKLPKIT